MAVKFRFTDYGLKKVLEEGIYETILNYGISDELHMYNVQQDNALLEILGHKTGSHRPFTDDAACLKSNVKPISVDTPTEEEFQKDNRRAVINLEYTNCANPYSKQNLVVDIDLAEWFEYLNNLPNTDYVKSVDVSLPIFDSVSYNIQEKTSDGSWDNIDTSELIVPTFRMLPGTLNNFTKTTSKWSINEDGVITYVDKSLQRFYNPMLINLLPKNIGGSFVEGQQLVITPYVASMGVVVNGNLNYMSFDRVGEPETYKTIKPAVKINNNTNGIYWMVNPEKTYKVDDYNKFAGQMTYNFVNEQGKYLIQGLVELMKNSVEFGFEETEFGVYKNTLQLQYMLDGRVMNSVSDSIGGKLEIRFTYDTNKTPTGNYNNIIQIIE